VSATARARAPMTGALHDIQAPVREPLEAVSAELRNIVTADFPLIAQVNEHLLRMQGKMFRPTLLLLSAAVDGAADRRAVPVAATVELVHLATLVHDDAVDHSVLRRGLPTINATFSHQISVIMGDYLYARSLAELVRREEMEAVRILADAATRMTVGEMRQLTAFDALSFSEEDYEVLIRAKTAALMSAACEMGALCGAPRHRVALARYGEQLGMAFQVADDLLDYTADVAEMGKPTGLDLREHKVTLPLIHALRIMPASARKTVERLFATAEPGDDAIADVVRIVTEYGGLEYARQRGERFARAAEEALAAIPESEVRSALGEAIVYVLDRRW
jgi:octaprenyl-diphosphate synthase